MVISVSEFLAWCEENNIDLSEVDWDDAFTESDYDGWVQVVEESSDD